MNLEKYSFIKVNLSTRGLYAANVCVYVFHIVILTVFITVESSRGCLYDCVSVYLSVCISGSSIVHTAEPFFDKNSHKCSLGYLQMPLSLIWKMSTWRLFCKNPMRHSHVFIFVPIFFKLAQDVAHILKLFIIKRSARFTTFVDPIWRTALSGGHF